MPPSKRWVIAILAVTVTVPLLLLFQRWRRKHHKNLELIVSKTPPTGQTGKLQLPRGHSVASAVQDLIKVGTTVILSPELLARANIHRETSRQRKSLPPGQPRRVKDPRPSPATKAAIESLTHPNSTLKQLENPGSEPPASPADKVAELLMIITPVIAIIDLDQEPLDGNHYPLLIAAATRRLRRRSKDSKNCSTPRIAFGTKTVVRRRTKRLSPLQTEQ